MMILRKKIVEKEQDAAHFLDRNKWRGRDDGVMKIF